MERYFLDSTSWHQTLQPLQPQYCGAEVTGSVQGSVSLHRG